MHPPPGDRLLPGLTVSYRLLPGRLTLAVVGMEAATTSYSYLPVRTRRSFAFLRYLAVKRHSVVASRTKVGTAAGDDTQEQNETVSTSRAAFVAGLPYGLHRPEVLKQLFETFGDVKDVAVHHKQVDHLLLPLLVMSGCPPTSNSRQCPFQRKHMDTLSYLLPHKNKHPCLQKFTRFHQELEAWQALALPI